MENNIFREHDILCLLCHRYGIYLCIHNYYSLNITGLLFGIFVAEDKDMGYTVIV